MKKLFICTFLILLNCNFIFADGMVISGALPELDNIQKLFVEEYIKAINSSDIDNQKKLIHPKCLACITPENKEFFDDLFLSHLNQSISSEYKAYIKKINPDENLPFSEYFTYPVLPTHLIQISDELGRKNLMIFVINQDGRYFHILPCPKPEFPQKYREGKIEKENHKNKVKKLFLELKDPLRSELEDLLNRGEKIQAMKKYCSETGESLAIAKGIVELLESEKNK